MNLPALHRKYCPACRRGDCWPVGKHHVPLVTSQYLREQRALEENRAARQAVRQVAARGHVVA